MIGWLIRFVVVFAVLTVIYVVLSWYMRWSQRQRLRTAYRGGARTFLSEDEYVSRGLAEYDRSLRRHLVLLVYVLPIVVLIALFLIGNYT